jgi:hypothetical protein
LFRRCQQFAVSEFVPSLLKSGASVCPSR